MKTPSPCRPATRRNFEKSAQHRAQEKTFGAPYLIEDRMNSLIESIIRVSVCISPLSVSFVTRPRAQVPELAVLSEIVEVVVQMKII